MHGRPGKVLYGQRAAEAAPVTPADRSGRHRRVMAPTAQAAGKFAPTMRRRQQKRSAGFAFGGSAAGAPPLVGGQ